MLPIRFTVELAAKSDLAFHFNARFNERSKKVIVRNSLIAKKWGKEERDLEHFPFIQGQPFEVRQTLLPFSPKEIPEMS